MADAVGPHHGAVVFVPLTSVKQCYESLQETGVIELPSQRTLRDYTHHTKATVGFSKEVDKQLQVAAKLSSCPEREKCVTIIMDETHLCEDLAYDKHTGNIMFTPYLVHFPSLSFVKSLLQPVFSCVLRCPQRICSHWRHQFSPC